MILRVLVLLLVVYSVDRATEAARYFGDLRFTRKNNDLDAKKARDIISSFVNAWKTSKILPNHQKNQPGETRSLKNFRNPNEEFLRLQPDYSLDRRNFLASRRNKLDKQSLFALENSLDPRPIKKHIRKPDQTEARTYFGGEHSDDEDDISPEMKLASLISKPVYHNMPGSFKHESDDDYKEFMFNNNGDMNDDNSIGLPNDDWRSGKRSSVTIPKGTVRFLAIEDDGNEAENRDKKFAILNAEQLEDIIRKQRNDIPSARKLIDQDIMERLFDERGDKKELITDPYNSLSLPVSDEVKGSEIDRKFYKYLPYRFMSSDYDDEESPAEFKLQKKNLWGDIQKRLRRSRINRKGQALKKLVNVKRSLLDSLGETGNSFDAYGSIGQDMAQSLMKVAADKADNIMKDAPCKQNAKLQENELADPRFSQTNPGGLLDASQLQQDMSRPSDNGIIQIAPEEPQKRSDFNADHVSRHKRAAIQMKKKMLQDSMAYKAPRKLKTADAMSNVGVPSSRSLPAHYLGGLPDSRGTESDDGITEDNEEESLDERLAHDSTPLLMKIAQHDGENLHKFWNNEHSAGNGFYTGHGEGPNHAYLGDYFGHGPEEMERDEGVKSLESSPSSEDHHTASLIDSIWEHDLGEDHLGEHHIERHHSAPKIKSYFGSHHAGGILLPAETMDGIDTHWTGHLPHMHASEYEHEGHALQFSPSRIKAIQAIQDDPGIDVELSPHEGIGTPMQGHAHHMHAFHNMDHSYGGMNLAPVVSDPVQVEDSHEEEYKQHIDNLLSQYHGLEEHLRGTGGTLAGHLDHANFGHHGHHQLHTGYDLYAYKNPWEGMRIPYHVPVINHPSGEQEEAPPSPLSFEGKTDEKGAPMVEGGKQEGGKGGPLVEGSKISTIKESKEKEGESSKGAKASENKAPLPVIPKQRGGPEISTGKNETNDNNHVTNGEAKQTMSDNSKTDSKSTAADKESKSESSAEEHKEKDAKESGNQSSSKEDEKSKSVGKDTESKSSDSKDNSELSPTEMFENIMNTNGKQSEMLNNLKAALGDQATNPKSLTALQFARLKQLSTMQQALLSSLAKQAVQASKDSKPDSAGSDMNEIKQLVELQNLQQLGAGSKAGSLINALRQNSLLHSLKAAQESILKNAKTHSAIKESSTKNGKQHDLSKLQASDIQGFFGKLPKNSVTSDLGDVGSEKFGSKIHASESPTAENDVAVSELIKELELAHAKKSAPAGVEAGVKPALSNLLRESLISNLKTRQTHQSKNKTAKTQNSSSSDKAYSSIGNEGPVTATAEESGHTRTTHLKEKRRSKSQTKHKKLNLEKDMMETGAAKAEILSYDDDKIDEDELSKKNIVKSRQR